AAVAAARRDALRAKHNRAIIRLPLADAPKRADAAALPRPSHQLGALGLHARHVFATGTHDREQRLDAVDAVPEQIGMVLLQRARTISVAAEHLADFRIVTHFQDAGAEAER